MPRHATKKWTYRLDGQSRLDEALRTHLGMTKKLFQNLRHDYVVPHAAVRSTSTGLMSGCV